MTTYTQHKHMTYPLIIFNYYTRLSTSDFLFTINIIRYIRSVYKTFFKDRGNLTDFVEFSVYVMANVNCKTN